MASGGAGSAVTPVLVAVIDPKYGIDGFSDASDASHYWADNRLQVLSDLVCIAALSRPGTELGTEISSHSTVSNTELRAALHAALDSYGVLPDLPSNYLHTTLTYSGNTTSIFAFAGSHNMDDWVLNSEFQQCTASEEGSLQPHLEGLRGRVHAGFARRLGAIIAGGNFLSEIDKVLDCSNRVIFTGHSLGGAVATLAAIMVLNRHVYLSPNALKA